MKTTLKVIAFLIVAFFAFGFFHTPDPSNADRNSVRECWDKWKSMGKWHGDSHIVYGMCKFEQEQFESKWKTKF